MQELTIVPEEYRRLIRTDAVYHWDLVREQRAFIRAGGVVPPILALPYLLLLIIADGGHKSTALGLERKPISALVLEGQQDQATLAALIQQGVVQYPGDQSLSTKFAQGMLPYQQYYQEICGAAARRGSVNLEQYLVENAHKAT